MLGGLLRVAQLQCCLNPTHKDVAGCQSDVLRIPTADWIDKSKKFTMAGLGVEMTSLRWCAGRHTARLDSTALLSC